MSSQMFSESWHLVADLRLCLLPTVTVHKQNFRGQEWYVFRDTLNDRFFRVRREAYQFIMGLVTSKTVDWCWEECLRRYPDTSPGQEEVIQLLSQLHASNLLYFSNRPNSEHIFERSRRVRRKEIQGKFLSFLFVRVPLWDPELWLENLKPMINSLFSFKGLLLWCVVIVLGVQACIENAGQVLDQAQGLLSPDNLVLVYIGMLILKIFHEFGHAMMCKRFGGSVHVMGVMFLVFTPLPYMDATASWAFRNRWHRVLVSAAGMIVELFFAALAALVWSHSGEGLIHSLAFNMMIIGSVSSFFFNGNPLLRFDAYYILSDALEIPNLYQRARDQWYYWVEKYLFGVENAFSPGDGIGETSWLAVYGVTSLLYRLFITLGIIIFVSDQWFVMGVVVLISTLYLMGIKPLSQLFMYLATSVKLQKVRVRAVGFSLLVCAVVFLCVFAIPFKGSIRAAGIVQDDPFVSVHSASNGVLKKVFYHSGDTVAQGSVLLAFENRGLALNVKITQAKIDEVKALQGRARHNQIADLQPIHARLLLLQEKLDDFHKQQKALLVRSDYSGVWISAKNIEHRMGTWFRRGAELGFISPNGKKRFVAVVSQEKAALLFSNAIENHGIRLWGAEGLDMAVSNVHLIPYEQTALPSAVLGWFGGGDVAVSSDDSQGKTSKESFFEVIAELHPKQKIPKLIHGRSGVLYLDLPAEPLGNKIAKNVQQLLQKRYQL